MGFDLATAKPASTGFDLSTAKPAPAAHPIDPTEGNSFGKNSLIGLGSAFDDLGLRAKQAYAGVADFVSPRERGVGDLITGKDVSRGAEVRAQIDEKRKLDAPLMNTWGGKTGSFVGKAAPAVAAAFVPGGQTLAGSMLIGAGAGALEPTATGESTLKNMMYGGAGGGAGYGVGKGIGALAGMASEKLAARGVQNKMVDDAVQAARDAGYSIPVSQSNPSSMLANGLDIVAGGRPTMAQAAALKNQPVTNKLAAKSLGLPADTPLSVKVLDQVRKDAFNNGYAPVRAAGDITPGPAYAAALDAIEQTSKGASRSFPGAVKNEIPEMVAPLRVGKFDAGDALEMTQVLRNAADKAYRAGDNALGKANKDASKAIEDAIEAHLQTAGAPDALAAFKAARTTIAKTYSVQKGLNDTTGNVSAKALASQLKAGKPLTGELESIARAAKLPGNSLREMMYATPGASQLEGLASTAGAVSTGNPLLLGIPYARSGIRNALLSGPVQRAIPAPSYQSGLLRALASNPAQIGANLSGQTLPQLSQK